MSPQLMADVHLHQVPGFRAMGVATGVKKERADLAIIVSDVPGTTGAAVFTQNAFAAAPVHVGRQHAGDGDLRAIVVNSGNANACTGRQGLRDALTMAEEAAAALGVEKEQILVCSTGIIGRPMPMAKIVPGIHECAKQLDAAKGNEASLAILTTDSGPKTAHRVFRANGRDYQIAGIAKGAGMIHPNMATMLGFMVTDAPIPADALRHGLKTAVDRSFNQITVDGDESTNDTCAILANGASGGDPLETGHPEWPAFQTALTELCQDLAKRIPADGEGATKLVTINVHGTANGDDARTLARGVAASILVKCAIHGNDPNWGRIIAALGQQGIPVDTQRIQIDFAAGGCRTTILDHGEPTGDLVEASEILSAPEITIDITVGEGPGKGLAWGCDMTTDYVTFNAEYHT